MNEVESELPTATVPANHRIHPHSRLLPFSPQIWYVIGSLPRTKISRNMTIFRNSKGQLIVHSAVAVEDSVWHEIEKLGKVVAIIVPSPIHRTDAIWFRAKCPRAKILAPDAAIKRVSKTVPVDGSCEALLPQLEVKPIQVPGVKPVELAYEVESGKGKCLLFCDILMNLENFSGLEGAILRTIGSTGFFGMTRIGRLLRLKDKAEFKGWLIQQSERVDLHSILPAHGDPIRTQISQRLKEAAERL